MSPANLIAPYNRPPVAWILPSVPMFFIVELNNQSRTRADILPLRPILAARVINLLPDTAALLARTVRAIMLPRWAVRIARRPRRLCRYVFSSENVLVASRYFFTSSADSSVFIVSFNLSSSRVLSAIFAASATVSSALISSVNFAASRVARTYFTTSSDFSNVLIVVPRPFNARDARADFVAPDITRPPPIVATVITTSSAISAYEIHCRFTSPAT